jgi:OOP family OmpA-OmpF porin
MRSFNGLLAILLTAMMTLSVSATAQPGPEKGNFYLNGGAVMYAPPDDDVFEDEAFGPAAAIGYGLSEKWAVELLYSSFDVDYEFPGDNGSDTTQLAWLDFLYDIGGNERWQPFLLFGGGYTGSDQGSRSTIDDAQVNAGVGVFRALNDRFSLRGDIRAVYSEQENSVQPFAFLGVTALLGKRQSNQLTAVPVTPADADSDGVVDGQDRCPNTPQGAAVDTRGCPLDSDADGVADYQDQCPDSAVGAKVDEQGCYVELEETVTIDLNLEFSTNSVELRPEQRDEIQRAVDFLRRYPTATAVIEGHTDSDGDAQYNQQLSERRAVTVLNNLVTQHRIAASRLRAVGYGESHPVASNGSAQGKQQNRRVSVVVSGTRRVRQ